MFLYKKVYSKLKEEILQGVYSAGTFLPSETVIAEKFEVDRTTVRKAISLLIDENMLERRATKGTLVIYNRDQSVEKDKELHVEETTTVGLKKTIAFFLPRSHNKSDRITIPFYSQLFYEVEKRSKDLGFTVIYSTLDKNDDMMGVLGQNLENLAGIIFVSNIAQKHIDGALLLKIPVVLVNGYSEKIPSITSDNFKGTYLACKNLMHRGHRKIGVLNGISQYQSAIDRLEGVIRCLQDNDLKLNTEFLISNNGWEYKNGFEAMKAFLDKSVELPTAFICFNDRLASGAMEAIHQKGLRIPEDISIVGYDNADICNWIYPKLSSIEINVSEMAGYAIGVLHYQITTKRLSPAKILIPVKYVERDSVKTVGS